MAILKIVGLVLLVVLPGGSLVLLAAAGYRAWKQRASLPSLGWAELRQLGRGMRLSYAGGSQRV